MGAGAAWVEDREEPGTEGGERVGVVVGGVGEEVGLGTGPVSFGDDGLVVVEVVESGGDGQGLLDVEVAVGQGGAGRLMGCGGVGEADLAVRGTWGDPGGAGQPGRCGPHAGGVGEAEGLGVPDDAGLELGPLGGDGGAFVDQLFGGGRVEVPHRVVGEVGELLAGEQHEREQRVLGVVVLGGGHGSTQALATDSLNPKIWLNHWVVDNLTGVAACGREVAHDGAGGVSRRLPAQPPRPPTAATAECGGSACGQQVPLVGDRATPVDLVDQVHDGDVGEVLAHQRFAGDGVDAAAGVPAALDQHQAATGA